jgi:hypothetical protein
MDETKLYSWFLGPKAENADLLERLVLIRRRVEAGHPPFGRRSRSIARLTRHVAPQLIQPDDGLGITRRAPISARR